MKMGITAMGALAAGSMLSACSSGIAESRRSGAASVDEQQNQGDAAASSADGGDGFRHVALPVRRTGRTAVGQQGARLPAGRRYRAWGSLSFKDLPPSFI